MILIKSTLSFPSILQFEIGNVLDHSFIRSISIINTSSFLPFMFTARTLLTLKMENFQKAIAPVGTWKLHESVTSSPFWKLGQIDQPTNQLTDDGQTWSGNKLHYFQDPIIICLFSVLSE